MPTPPTIFTVPCFAGAPWKVAQLTALADHDVRTMRLPDELQTVDAVADFIATQVAGNDNYVLVGDSFGAVAALAFAVRRPPGLRALVLSGGFAANPITSPLIKALAALAPLFPGPFYRALTLRYHAYNLRSVFDREGEIAWSQKHTLELFRRNTSHRAFVNRAKAAFAADYVDGLAKITVPTLILTPEDDKLIGSEAAGVMLGGIRGGQGSGAAANGPHVPVLASTGVLNCDPGVSARGAPAGAGQRSR